MLKSFNTFNRIMLSVVFAIVAVSLAIGVVYLRRLETPQAEPAPEQLTYVAPREEPTGSTPPAGLPAASERIEPPPAVTAAPSNTRIEPDPKPQRRTLARTDLPFDWRKQPEAASDRMAPNAIQLSSLDGGQRKLSNFEKKRQKAAQGLSFRLLTLRDENGKIPNDGLSKARHHVNRMRSERDAKARAEGKDSSKLEFAGLEASDWAWLGPGNVGGRIRSIVIDPSNANNLLVGSVSGGIWRSTDTGNSWQPVNDFMANLAISSMVRHPNDPNVIYAGTGEAFSTNLDNVGRGFSSRIKGLGVFQSTDGGNTWTQLASTNPADGAVCALADATCPWSYVNRLAVSPDGTILAATAAGIWRSDNGGVSWTQGAGANDIVWDVDFDPTNSQRAIAGGEGAAAFTTDGGVNWTLVDPGLSGRVEVAYAPSNPSIVYASVDQNRGEVYISNNGGETYSPRNTDNSLLGGQGAYDNIIWVNPLDPNFVIVGGVVLWRSTDAGMNFTQISTNTQHPDSAHPDHHMIIASAGFNNASDKSVYFANDGGIHRADDVSTVSQTNGWTHRNHNLGVTQFYGGAVTLKGIVFGGTQDNGNIKVLPTTGFTPPYNPETWETIIGATGDGFFVAADPTDADYIYTEYTYGTIQRSSNGGLGSGFIYCNPEPPRQADGSPGLCMPPANGIFDAQNGANFVTPFILDPNNPNTLLLGGLSLWRSTDIKTLGYPSWAPIKPQALATPEPSPSPTPTPGPDPTPSPTPTPPVAISAIAVANGNSDFVVVGHNDGQIFLSENGTNSPPTDWVPIHNGTPNRFVTRLAIDSTKNPNWIYATFGGFANNNVLVTRDLGATWIDVSGVTGSGTDLPAVPVRSIVLSPVEPNNLYIGTEVGIFTSEDAGVTWQLPQGGPANVSVDELFWYQGDLFAATHGRGMYKTHVPVFSSGRCVFNVDDDLGCPNTTCAPGQIACTGSNCTCCTAGAWNCPCSWNTQKVPTATDDPYVSCPMTGGGGAGSITIGPGGGVTFNGSGGLRAFGDFTNFGFVRVVDPFGSSQIAADGHITNFGSIQMPGDVICGGVLTNHGIISVSSNVTAKGLATSTESSLLMNRMTIEGDVNHLGLVQDNGLATFQSLMDFRSTPGMTSTFAGSGRWVGPRGHFLPGSSFRLESNVAIELADFRNSGTLDVQGNQLTFTGSNFANFPQQAADGRGIIGTGVVAMAPSGNATFVNASRDFGPPIEFTPQLKIASGNVSTSGDVNEVVVDAGATMLAGIMSVGGNLTVNGTIEPLDPGTSYINFNGATLTNNGTIGNLFLLNFNTTGVAGNQNISGAGTWSPRNVRLGLYSPSTTNLTLDNDIRFSTNDFIIATGSTLVLSTRTITLAGPVRLFNDGSITGNFGTVKFEATGSGGQIASGLGALFGSQIEVASGQVSVRPGTNVLTFERDFRVNSGATFTMTGPAVVANRSVLNNGTINILPGTPFAVFEPRGQTFTNNGSITGAGLIFRFGPGIGGPFTHQVSGTGTWSAMEQILVNTGSTLELLADVTYSGNSIHLLGNLNTLSNTLTLPCTTSWGGPGETFGNVRRTNLAACTGPIAFGNPATTLQFTGGTAPSEATVSIIPSPPVDFANAISRRYSISEVGGSGWTAAVQLHYLDSELNGNSEAGLNMFRNAGGGWIGLGASSRDSSANWVRVIGVTEFSEWALSSFAGPPAPNSSPVLSNVAVTPSVNEGGQAALTGNISDTDSGDAFTLTVDWGDGTTPQVVNYPAGTSSFNLGHIYADNPAGAPAGSYSVSISLSDNAGGTDTESVSVNVNNVAPSLTGLAVQPGTAAPGSPVTLSANITEPGAPDSFAVEINWGDGSTNSTFALPAGTVNFNTQHTFVSPGVFTVTVGIADNDGGSSQAQTSVTVVDAPPAAPSGLVVDSFSLTQVTLSWVDSSSNETEFRIERCAGGKKCNKFSQVSTTTANIAMFTDTTVARNTNYHYRVAACNTGGCSAYSNTVVVKTPRK